MERKTEEERGGAYLGRAELRGMKPGMTLKRTCYTTREFNNMKEAAYSGRRWLISQGREGAERIRVRTCATERPMWVEVSWVAEESRSAGAEWNEMK